jgi:hypothetical protein
MTGRFLALARSWFDADTVACVFEPLIADWQHEAAAASGPRRAACLVRGAVAFATTFLITFGRDLLRPTPTELSRIAWRSIAVFASLGTLLLLVPVVSGLYPVYWSARVELLLPSALALAVPAAVAPTTILLLSNARGDPAASRRAIVRFALSATIATAAIAGWAAPLANQGWREAVASTLARRSVVVSPARGVRELTLPELARRQPPPGIVDGQHRDREYHMRLLVVTMPIPMALLAFAAARRVRVGWIGAAAWWIAAPLLWYTAFFLVAASVRAYHWPAATVWISQAVLLLIAVVIGRQRHAESMRALSQTP